MATSRFGKRASPWLALLVLLCALFAGASLAATEHYEYDAIGRLIRYIDSRGGVTEYVYDPVGNILAVRAAGPVLPPTVASINPQSMRRGQSAQVTITGSNLSNALVSVDDPGLALSGVTTSANQIGFTLAVAVTAALGAQPIRVTNSAGEAAATLVVGPVLPKVLVDPSPLAIAPDKVAREITVRLSHADTLEHTLALSASNARFSVAPASVTIAAGQTQAKATVTGLSVGQATLTLASATLGNTLVPVFITGEFVGLNTSFSAPLGVVLGSAEPPPSPPIGPVASRTLGVVVGGFVRGVAPKSHAVGSGPTLLTISGVGLEAAQSVAIAPSTGITLGAVSVAPDGNSVTVPISVAADAPISPRRVIVTGPAGVIPAAAADADRINVVRPPPELVSIDPIVGLPETLIALTIRGRNLQDAVSVSLSPSTGVTVGATPSVSADGNVLTAMVAIAFNAPTGPRTVVVTTPGGSSSAVPSPANTFTIGSQVVRIVTPVVSPQLGVVLQGSAPPPGTQTDLFTSALGVTVGSVATSLSPDVGVVGQGIVLTVQGRELGAVTAVQFLPAEGLAAGPVAVAGDGRSLTVPVTIAADAPQSLRTVKVLAGTAAVPFASPGAAQFRVAAPVAVIESMTPITLQVGQPLAMLTIRGRNFFNAQQVRVVPADGTSIQSPVVSAGGTEISVMIAAAANAAIGPRAVVVVTPGGESSSALAPPNTLTFTATPGTAVTPVVSPLLGVVRLDSAPPPSLTIGPVVAPLLGVVLGEVTPPPAPSRTAFGNALGVALGPVAMAVSPTGFAPDSKGSLAIAGFALDSVTAVAVQPAEGVTLGAAVIAPDGRQLTVPIEVSAAAPATVREVRVQSADGHIAFADPTASRIVIGPGVPQFDSITPIVAVQGTSFALTIRGANFTGAIAVAALPAIGTTFSNTFTVNAAGTQLDISVVIAPDAPVGPRVIQVIVPGAVSSVTPTPANTMSVVAP